MSVPSVLLLILRFIIFYLLIIALVSFDVRYLIQKSVVILIFYILLLHHSSDKMCYTAGAVSDEEF